MQYGLVPKEIRLIRRKDTGRVTTMLHPRLTLSRSIDGVVNMIRFNAFQPIKALNMFQIVAIPVALKVDSVSPKMCCQHGVDRNPIANAIMKHLFVVDFFSR